jgi:ubiquinone/menaquinone biosynthesis C-methylase UbiE
LKAHHDRLSFLDIGCGTGLYSIALAEDVGLDFTGIDLSEEMLEQARRKCPQGTWLLGDIVNVEFGNETFHAALMSYVIQHINYRRVLPRVHGFLKRPGGLLFIVTDDHDQFLADPYHRYIPELMEIDLGRFPEVSDLCRHLDEIGFETRTERVCRETSISDEDGVKNLVERGKARYFSTLTLLSDEELHTGLISMERGLLNELESGPVVRKREKTIVIARTRWGGSP